MAMKTYTLDELNRQIRKVTKNKGVSLTILP